MNKYIFPYNLYIEVLNVFFETPIPVIHVRGILQAISTLDQKEQIAIIRYYREGKTYAEIAPELNVTSKERVRQIIAKAIRKLNHPSRKNLFAMKFNPNGGTHEKSRNP